MGWCVTLISYTYLIVGNPYQIVLHTKLYYFLSEHYNNALINQQWFYWYQIVHSRLLCHLSFLILISFLCVWENINVAHVISKFHKEVLFGIIKQANQTNIKIKLLNHYCIPTIRSYYQMQPFLWWILALILYVVY